MNLYARIFLAVLVLAVGVVYAAIAAGNWESYRRVYSKRVKQARLIEAVVYGLVGVLLAGISVVIAFWDTAP